MGLLAVFALIFFLYPRSEERLYRIQENGKYGFIDSLGKVVINPQYKYISAFNNDGFALVICDAKIIQFDNSDPINQRLEPLYRVLYHSDDLSYNPLDSLSITYGFINMKNELVVDTANVLSLSFADSSVFWFKQEMSPLDFVEQFHSGSLPFRTTIWEELQLSEDRYLFQDPNSHLFGYKNLKGEIIINPVFSYGSHFFKNRAFVCADFKNSSDTLNNHSNDLNKYGLIDINGNYLKESTWCDVSPYNTWGLAWVLNAVVDSNYQTNTDWQQIDLDGNATIGPIQGGPCLNMIYNNYLSPDKLYIYELVSPDIGTLYTYVDENGLFLSDFDHDNLLSIDFSDDSKNELYSNVTPFSEGVAARKIFNKNNNQSAWIFVNKSLNYISEPYDSVVPFSEGLAGVQENTREMEGLPHLGKWGFVNHNFETVIPFKFSEIEMFVGGLSYAKISGTTYDKEGYINKKGEFVWSCNRRKQ